MKRELKVALVALCGLLCACGGPSWSDQEQALIDQAAYSRMALVTIDSRADSLLLRTPSAPLTREDILSPTFGRLASSLIETVRDEHNPGVGIAAPQVGVLRQVVAVQRLDKPSDPFEIYVNPTIVWRSEEVAIGGEGCLSVPGRSGNVARSTAIEVAYNDAVTFEPLRERIEGFVAVIFQHEIDHLSGTLYIDKLQ